MHGWSFEGLDCLSWHGVVFSCCICMVSMLVAPVHTRFLFLSQWVYAYITRCLGIGYMLT